MSWNNVLPWWYYAVNYEHFEAMCCCAFPEELLAGWTRSVPESVIRLAQDEQL
jgi:hypothetical protein